MKIKVSKYDDLKFRVLLYGIVRTIRPLGPLDGLLGGRFKLAFLSVVCIIGAKGWHIGNVVEAYTLEIITLPTATLVIGIQFVPQIMLATFTTIGCSKNSMKLFVYHPETLLLPAGTKFIIFIDCSITFDILLVTFFTVSKVNVLCGPYDHRIGISKGWTYANIITSTIAYTVGNYCQAQVPNL